MKKIKLEEAVTKSFLQREEFKEWINECDKTYENFRSILEKDYGGKCIAIDGKRLVEIAQNFTELEKKYYRPNTPQVMIYYILSGEESEIRLPICRIIDS